jgi:hypothetical protein
MVCVKKHGFDSITFNSAQNADGVNNFIFDSMRREISKSQSGLS